MSFIKYQIGNTHTHPSMAFDFGGICPNQISMLISASLCLQPCCHRNLLHLPFLKQAWSAVVPMATVVQKQKPEIMHAILWCHFVTLWPAAHSLSHYSSKHSRVVDTSACPGATVEGTGEWFSTDPLPPQLWWPSCTHQHTHTRTVTLTCAHELSLWLKADVWAGGKSKTTQTFIQLQV